jgi:hypothetical protein
MSFTAATSRRISSTFPLQTISKYKSFSLHATPAELTSFEPIEYFFYGLERSSREAEKDVREHLQQIRLAIVSSNSTVVSSYLH